MILNKLKFLVVIVLLVSLTGCNDKSDTQIDEEKENNRYQTGIENYRKELMQNRKKGYLQLVGLMKMDKDKMVFGADSTNYLFLNSKNAPQRIGSFLKTDSVFVFKAAPNVKIKMNNYFVLEDVKLKLDEYGSSQLLEHKNIRWQLITRNNQPYLRVWDSDNPEVDIFNGFEFFSLNKDMLFEADFKYYNNAKSEKVKSQLGPMTSTEFIGQVSFNYEGKLHSMDVGNNGFLMVADQTTGNNTYGGGRYIYLDLPEIDGKLVLDFNRLYNPPCSFNKYTTCLYPPRQNELPFKVEAGETINPIN